MQEHIYDVLLAPIYTEKATIGNESSKFIFKVSATATKIQVKNAIEKVFGVKVNDVNIINVRPKKKVFKGRIGKRSGYKKAIVSLQKGENLDLGTGV